MNISEQDVNEIVLIFSNFLNENNEIRQKAENDINKKMNSDVIKFLSCCSSIIRNEQSQISHIFFALQSISRSFLMPGVSIGFISEQWSQVDIIIKNYIKESLLFALKYNDQRVTNMASKAFCTLLIVEKISIFPLLEKVIQIIENNENEEMSIAGLDVINEVCGPNYLRLYNKYESVIEFLKMLNFRMLSLFINSFNRSSKYQEKIALVIDTLIGTAQPLYQNNEIVMNLTNLIQQFLNNDISDGLYETLFHILLNLSIANYWRNDFNFQLINKVTINEINADQVKSKEKLSIAIEFWTNISEFELTQIEKIQKYEKLIKSYEIYIKERRLTERCPKIPTQRPLEFRNLSSMAGSLLVNPLLSLMLLIDPSDTSSEDVSIKEPHMDAMCCLVNFFKINPQDIFNAVKLFWIGQNPYSLTWTHQHALILTIGLICNKPESDEVLSFITEEITPNFVILRDFLIPMLKSNVDKIVDTTLYTLKHFIQHYIFVPSPDLFNILLESISNLYQNCDDFIYQRILYLLSTIFIAVQQRNQCHIIFENYEKICNIIFDGINNSKRSIDCYILSTRVLETLIFRSNRNSFELLQNILLLSLNNLKDLISSFFHDQTTTIKQQHQLGIIKSFYYTFQENPQLIELSPDVVNTIFNLMEQKTIVYDSALQTLVSIITSLKQISENLIDGILQFVPISLSSGSPSIISNTAYALASLFKEVFKNRESPPQVLIDGLPNTFGLIENCLKDSLFTRDFYPLLLTSLAKIIKSTGQYIPILKIEEMIQLYTFFIDKPLDPEDENDVSFGNELYSSIFAGFSGILNALDNHNEEKYRNDKTFSRFLMTNPPRKFLNLRNLSDQCLISFCKYLHSFYHFFQRKANSNVLLNRSTNYTILVYACASSSKKTHSIGFETLQLISTI